MRPTRRDFLRYLLTTPLALTVDYEQLLWSPRSLIVVPSLRTAVTIEEINAVTMRTFLPGVLDAMFAPSPLIEYLRGHR